MLAGPVTLGCGQQHQIKIVEKRPGPPEADGSYAPHCWMTICAKQLLEMEAQLAAKYFKDPKAEPRPRLLGEGLGHLRNVVRLAAAGVTTHHRGSYAELWAERQFLQKRRESSVVSPEHQPEQIYCNVVRVLAIHSLNMGGLETLLGAAATAAGGSRKDARRHVVTAGRWLIQAQNAVPRSPEQFMFYYLTLETLTAEVREVPVLARFRNEISREAPEVLTRLQEFEGEVSKGVRVRFRVLARSLFPEQAKDDADAFRRIAEVRNDLIHGRLSDIPLDEEPNVNSLVQDLAERYLHAVLDHSI